MLRAENTPKKKGIIMPVQLIIERIENEYRCLQMEYELGEMTEDEYTYRADQVAMSSEWLVFVNELPSLY